MSEWVTIQNQVLALVFNVLSWASSLVFTPAPLLKKNEDSAVAVSIGGPGGLDRLQLEDLDESNRICVGYNLRELGHPPPYVTVEPSKKDEVLHPSLIQVDIDYFSLNYADVCIRWGLYESANRFVGWPIVPGFDFSGKVAWMGAEAAKDSGFKLGDLVYGVTMFGAYSSRVLVPARQLRKVPTIKAEKTLMSQAKAASVLAVASTALHAVALARGWPNEVITMNKACLIHSAAGGVGSLLIQICKARGYSPIVAVVGRSDKVSHCTELGADFVIDKSKEKNLWEKAEEISAGKGFCAIFDANGVETLKASYEHLDACGSLVVYGFHSNLPKATDLNPLNWFKVISRMGAMPRFDPMELTLKNKSISGFNLSFLESEVDTIALYFDQIDKWLEDGTINVLEPTEFEITEIREAHALIQSGTSKGKIVLKT
jgi:NADPH:quinone reductase-like Zn-dependent oxidoreductase